MADEVKLTYISGLSGLTANVFSGDGTPREMMVMQLLCRILDTWDCI